MELGEHLDTFFLCQLLKIAALMAAYSTAWQKTSFVQTAWSFRPKNHSKSLLGPYECKLQSRFCSLALSSAVAAVVFLVIEKPGSQVFFLSLTPLMWHYIVKITWFRPKTPCPQRI
jgi:hypothetical protein